MVFRLTNQASNPIGDSNGRRNLQTKVARSLGGDMTLELEPGQKLEMITWKEDSLWYLTRPMRDDEEPETHTFQQSSEFGVFEGTVTIVESVVEGENAS